MILQAYATAYLSSLLCQVLVETRTAIGKGSRNIKWQRPFIILIYLIFPQLWSNILRGLWYFVSLSLSLPLSLSPPPAPPAPPTPPTPPHFSTIGRGSTGDSISPNYTMIVGHSGYSDRLRGWYEDSRPFDESHVSWKSVQFAHHTYFTKFVESSWSFNL